MPRQSPIVKLRNKLSHLLFENKEKMEENTYKILYETLRDETKDVSEEDEMVWCKFTYIKSKVKYCQSCLEREDAEATQTSLSVNTCRRNIQVKRKSYERMKKLLDEYPGQVGGYLGWLSWRHVGGEEAESEAEGRVAGPKAA